MRPLINEVETTVEPDLLAQGLLKSAEGLVLLRSGGDFPQARYTLIAANPFMVFRSFGSRCETHRPGSYASHVQFGNPLQILSTLMARFELLDELDLPFPLGGCFGFWGYDLKNFTEPKLPRRALNDLDLPDCCAGFYDSLVIFDHQLARAFIVSTGLDADGSRCDKRANEQFESWQQLIHSTARSPSAVAEATAGVRSRALLESAKRTGSIVSNFTREEFINAVKLAQDYIRTGNIYQVNLSQRLSVQSIASGWELFQRLNAVSPAPFAAFLNCGDFQIASSSPEQFLRLSGRHIITRPIKGTRPRNTDATRDAQLGYELQTSAKELAELIMITDLLRNDLGKICEFGSVQVPELAKLEKFAQVQHLVSTIDGRLRHGVTHCAALASCFPGGSITGAPKFRAMEIIDELEPVTRGPYCGCHGYLGFNRESQLSITIRTAICAHDRIHFNVGAGIVADSNPEFEYEETLAKAAGFQMALTNADTRIFSHSRF
ncbi:MAG TPA: aminodeoxychorismate synthase component I [Candidatus Sulfotelmatobacter sp.]|nr:aminodeoxychorismate synthase component I [Candidatus Sulfotelmatobacter sp.]